MALGLCLSVAALAGVGGWFAAGYQHVLFRDPVQRRTPATGRRLLVLRTFLAASSALVAGLALRPGHYHAGPALLTVGFGLAFCVAASTDFDRRLIPDWISLPAAAAALAFAWAWPDRSVADIVAGGGFALGIAVVLVVLGVAVGGALGARATPFGIGDAKLILLIGLVCGWPGVMSALLYGMILAGVVAVVILVRRGAKSVYAYGPYLALGALIVLLWPEKFV